jgi:hypothetical protein
MDEDGLEDLGRGCWSRPKQVYQVVTDDDDDDDDDDDYGDDYLFAAQHWNLSLAESRPCLSTLFFAIN